MHAMSTDEIIRSFSTGWFLRRRCWLCCPRGSCAFCGNEIGAQQINWSVLQVFHQSEAISQVNAVAMKQAFIQQNKVWCAIVKEFQGRQAIRNVYNLIGRLLCK